MCSRRDFYDVPVEHAAHIVIVAEDESLFLIKAACYDVLDILLPQSVCLIR